MPEGLMTAAPFIILFAGFLLEVIFIRRIIAREQERKGYSVAQYYLAPWQILAGIGACATVALTTLALLGV